MAKKADHNATLYAQACLREFEDAVRAHAFMGAQDPDDWKGIEERYEQAKAKLKRQLRQKNQYDKP